MTRRNDDMPDEANRYDGAPAPSKPQPAPPPKAEVEQQRRETLADRGCANCDETDPDELAFRPPLLPNCSAMQGPPPGSDPRVVLCDDCADERPDSYRDKEMAEAREAGERDVLAVYACGCVAKHDLKPPTAEGPDGEEMVMPGQPNAEIQAVHRCGETLDDVVFLDDA